MVTVAEATAELSGAEAGRRGSGSLAQCGRPQRRRSQRLVSRGYETFAVNPNADEIDGKPCFRSGTSAAIPRRRGRRRHRHGAGRGG